MARDFLAVQGSSVPCERLFSSASLIDTDRRNRLNPSTFSAIETVKNHLKFKRRAQDIRLEGNEQELMVE